MTLCFHSKLVGAVMVVESGGSIVDGYVMCHPKCGVITISWLNSEIITFLYDFVQKNLGCFGRMYFCMQLFDGACCGSGLGRLVQIFRWSSVDA